MASEVPSFSDQSTIRASDDQVSSNVGDEAVILDLSEGTYFSLDSIGAHIWKLIQEPITLNQLIDQLTKDYQVDRVTCKEDVVVLLREMYENNLIEVESE